MVSSADNKNISYSSPLERLDVRRTPHTYPGNFPSRKIQKRHFVDLKLTQKMTLIIDDVGARMKDQDKIDILFKPAATLYMVTGLFRDAKIPLDNAHIAIHVGSNSIHEFR